MGEDGGFCGAHHIGQRMSTPPESAQLGEKRPTIPGKRETQQNECIHFIAEVMLIGILAPKQKKCFKKIISAHKPQWS